MKKEIEKTESLEEIAAIEYDAQWNKELAIVAEKTKKEILALAKELGKNEMRELVDTFYQMQAERIKGGQRNDAAVRDGEPGGYTLIRYFCAKHKESEDNIQYALSHAVKKYPIAKWLKTVCGVGPVITAGLIAHIDISKVDTYGQIHRYAGLDPTLEWKEGQKRPWNAKLKVLCWKIGASFVTFSGNPKCVYGHLYREKKEEYIERNAIGGFKENAAENLKRLEKIAKRNPKVKLTEEYKANQEGRLSKGHIDLMARRYAVKLFLAHLFEVWYRLERGKEPPVPFSIAHQGHAHYLAPLNVGAAGLKPWWA